MHRAIGNILSSVIYFRSHYYSSIILTGIDRWEISCESCKKSKTVSLYQSLNNTLLSIFLNFLVKIKMPLSMGY